MEDREVVIGILVLNCTHILINLLTQWELKSTHFNISSIANLLDIISFFVIHWSKLRKNKSIKLQFPCKTRNLQTHFNSLFHTHLQNKRETSTTFCTMVKSNDRYILNIFYVIKDGKSRIQDLSSFSIIFDYKRIKNCWVGILI